ncbi:MAG: KdsC family phosphatase [Ignavibacterium sp.]|uniref:KdsC family phosphatase n=1 Tax=Ignavibacterium sp. TaxID=2651167 RepID=UPI004048F16E
MVIDKKLAEKNLHLKAKAEKIKLVITDVDGVLTDTGIYYSPTGEALKRYSIRDGMGVERLRKYADIETIIITGENSEIVKSRAEKLKITQVYLGVKDKKSLLEEIKKKNQLENENIAYIGDDSNDYDIMKLVGFTATPADGMNFIKEISNYVCENKGGYGAFREFAELLISLKQ